MPACLCLDLYANCLNIFLIGVCLCVGLFLAACSTPNSLPRTDSFTHSTQQVFHQIMVGIYFHQAMLLCILLVKKFPYALLVLPLCIFTVVFHIVNAAQFKRPWKLGNAREAALLDARDHVSCGW